jgi:hypothetical protein
MLDRFPWHKSKLAMMFPVMALLGRSSAAYFWFGTVAETHTTHRDKEYTPRLFELINKDAFLNELWRGAGLSATDYRLTSREVEPI